MTNQRNKRTWTPSNLTIIIFILFSIFLLFTFFYTESSRFKLLLFGDSRSFFEVLLILVSRCIFWILGGFAGYYGSCTLGNWYETYRKFGFISVEIKDLMKTLASISKMNELNKLNRIFLLYLGLFGFIAFVFLRIWIILFLVALAIIIILWDEIRISRPPTILFLSSSSIRCLNLFWNFQMLYRPLRTVALLDLDIIPEDNAGEIILDCLRTTNSDDWWEVILKLFQIIPIIIIDTSVITPGIKREGEYALSMGFEYKCIFLSDMNHKYPLLDLIAPSTWKHNQYLCFITHDKIINLIDKVLNSEELPTKKCPIVQFME